MVKQVVSSVLYRVLLPLVLLTAVAFRYNAFSFIYLLLMLLNPLLPGPSPENIRSGHPKRYLITVLVTSILFCVAHVVFQVVLLIRPGGYGKGFDYCTRDGRIYALMGFHNLHKANPLDAIRLIGLDFLVLFVTFGVFITCSKLELPERSPSTQEIEQSDVSHTVRRKKRKKSEILYWTGEILVLAFLAGAGILYPSLSSSVYFLIFLFVCTWFACNQKIGQRYLLTKIPLAVFCVLHFVILYLYQLDYIRQFVPPKSLVARLIGLVDLIEIDCVKARTLTFTQDHWNLYVSPLFILGLFWLLALILRYHLVSLAKEECVKEEPPASRVDSMQSSRRSAGSVRRRRQSTKIGSRGEDRIRLLDDDRMGRGYQSTAAVSTEFDAKETLAVDPNGSVIWTSESDVPDKTADGETPTTTGIALKLRKVSSPVVSALKLIAKGSYVATLIIMMTWSITYHSWLTFVLLLWSCILWMCPNSRQACLKTSPALVAYAEALLLLQYVLGLRLSDEELPKFDKTIVQIGFYKYGDLTYQPLAIKILYTMMFWITLRQFIVEKQESSRRDISEGVMLEPFNISYCTAQPAFPRPSLRRHFSIVPSMTSPNPYIRLLAETVYSLLVKYWIWVVAIMLMVISLGGNDVVVYRIVYMFLFLFFILMFQFSYYFWRKIMYGFWLTVIIFSMLVLILIYTYQFSGFDEYWADYLKISRSMQKDLGLEVYDSDTGALFLKLLTPTFFLIITIIQLHYFHKEFLLISDLNYKSYEYLAEQSTVLTVASATAPDDSTQTHVTIEPETESHNTGDRPDENKHLALAKIAAGDGQSSAPQSPLTPSKDDLDSTRAEREFKAIKSCLENVFMKITKVFSFMSELTWRLLELHIIKIVLFSVFCLAAFDVSAVHFVYVGFVIVALPIRSLQSFFSHCCSIWTASLLLSKMIYQLNIAGALNWEVNCTDVTGKNASDLPFPLNQTIDSREWIGFKTTDDLVHYCRGYIGLILVLTIQAVVKIRQKVNRLNQNKPEPKPGVLFPDSTRATADQNILECVKFLANYFFYKFGLEVCFITAVACVGTRLDVFATLTAIWLCILFLLRRKTLAKIWPIFVAYQCIVLPIQYLMCVGLPPGMCIEYEWVGALEKSLREWLFLPDYQNPPDAHKLIVDFFQLLFACCQLFVFQIEVSPIADMYEGGSNKEIYYEDGNTSLKNPVPDFVTYTKSSLDMVKVLVFFSFFWVTLAVVFLAGTSRVNMFAMGYVVGCFYFLWNGNEFYLKNRRALLKLWNILIAYNVIVILIKTVLQLVGCVYIQELEKNCCWVVQLFGIACLKKGAPDLPPNEQCTSDDSVAGIIMDGVCFGFLLLQKRLFSSYYFQHLVNEIKAQQVLSSRGAELIHEIQMKEVQEQQAAQKEIMEKIKKKMDRIRAYQEKIRGGGNMEPKTHFQAIRSGDYYMFEDYSDEDIDLELSARHKRTDDEENENAEVKEKGINALLSKTIRGSLRVVEEPRKESGEVDDVGDSSQQSAIVSADRYPITSSSEKTSFKSPDPLTISSSGPTMSLSLPSRHTPSTSFEKDEDITTLQEVKLEEEEEEEEETFVEKIKRWWDFVCEFVNSVLISSTAKLNTVSRDYRFVARQLSKEKKLLKEKFIRDGSFDMIEAEADMKSRDIETLPGSSKDLKQLCITATQQSLDFIDSAELQSTPDALDEEFQKSQSVFMKFMVACYYAAISRSELFCYIIIIINQMKTATILSLPLPLFVFLWGTLSVPRPTKAFWITIITYTEAIVVVKYLFQFYFFEWNQKDPPPNEPFSVPLILGIRRNDNYAVYDLVVLMVVFFHRIMLKSLGLWKDTDRNISMPSDDDASGDNISETHDEEILEAPPPVPAITKDAATTDENISSDSHDECSEEDDEIETVLEELQARINIRECVQKFVHPIRLFFYRLLYPKYRITIDVYAFMFFCDFINFFIVMFGYSSFGTGGGGGITSYFEKNEVPIPFLIMLIMQFALIVTDRALYLRKYILGKLIFQVFLVFLVHMAMFFILPAITLKQFVDPHNNPPKMWYFIKCVYLLLSAHQIRSGYPTRILGNFFCKKYNYANYFLFIVYRLIPFLYELRSLMDWIWTDTSMNISNWLKMEDIYSNIFVLKCVRRAEDAYPTPRGAKRTALIKYGVGGSLLLVIIFVIWFPLLLFALGSTVGRNNIPTSCTIQLEISGFEPLFRMTALQNQIKTLNKNQWNRLKSEVSLFNEPSISALLYSYDKEDTAIVELYNESTSVWTISPPSRTALVNVLNGDSDLEMVLSWSFSRNSTTPDILKEIKDQKVIELTQQLRKQLANMISSNETLDPVYLVEIFPNYVVVPGKGKSVVVDQFYPRGSTRSFFGSSPFRNLETKLMSSNDTRVTKWWKIFDNCTKNGKPPYDLPDINNCNMLRLITFNDKAFPTELSVLSGYGIVGLYTTFVLVVWRFARGFVAGSSFVIMFEDMPYVDRVLQLCLDIYLVRESNEFSLEEDLFAKLIFLYRSPETLIKWTRPPDQDSEESNSPPMPALQQ